MHETLSRSTASDVVVFFFQAEDGIRDLTVTGVQTCALPICDWKPAPRLEPSSLAAQQTLAGARLDAAAWPADQWWRGYGDAQLDALIAEALAGSPSLEIAAARLRSAQAQAIAAGAVRGPAAPARARAPPPPYPPPGAVPPPLPRRPPPHARRAA